MPDAAPVASPADVAPVAPPADVAQVAPPADVAQVAAPADVAQVAAPAAAASRSLPPAIPPAPPVPDAIAATPTGATPLDARALARSSLAAGRSPSLWWVCTGVVTALLVTYLVGPSPGAAVLAGLLAVSAVARAVLRPGPVGLTVRSRALDSAMLAALAGGVGLLSQLIPTG